MNPKTYILQKDLPNVKAGTYFIYDDSTSGTNCYHCAENYKIFFTRELVEDVPEWFKLKEEESCVFNLDKINHQIEKLEYAKEVTIDFAYSINSQRYRRGSVDVDDDKTYLIKKYEDYLKSKSNEQQH